MKVNYSVRINQEVLNKFNLTWEQLGVEREEIDSEIGKRLSNWTNISLRSEFLPRKDDIVILHLNGKYKVAGVVGITMYNLQKETVNIELKVYSISAVETEETTSAIQPFAVWTTNEDK